MADEGQKGYPTQPQPTQPPPGPGYPPQPQQGYPPQPEQGYPPQQGYPPPGTYPGPEAPPPAYSAAYPPPPQGQTVVVSTVHSTVVQTFREHPANVTCPNCKNNVTTNTVYENGALVILLILVIAFVFQLWCGCCLIPLCINDLKDVHHICPVCSYRVGTFKRL